MWWNKQTKQHQGFSVHPEFFLGAQTSSAGSIDLESDIMIDGRFKGDVSSTGLIELGANSDVSADITARVGIIEGKYSGNAKFKDEVQVKNCSNVSGELTSSNIVVEKGAQLSVNCKTLS